MTKQSPDVLGEQTVSPTPIISQSRFNVGGPDKGGSVTEHVVEGGLTIRLYLAVHAPAQEIAAMTTGGTFAERRLIWADAMLREYCNANH